MTDTLEPLIEPELLLQVHTILRIQRLMKQAMIQWHGLPPSENSWEDLPLL